MKFIILILTILQLVSCINEQGILVIENPVELQGTKYSIEAMIAGNGYQHNIRDTKINIIMSNPFDGCCPISLIPPAVQLNNYFLLSDGVNDKCTDGKRIHYARQAYARGLFIIKQKQKNQSFSYWLQYNDPSMLVFFIQIENNSKILNYTNAVIQASIHMFPNVQQKQVNIWISSFDFVSYQLLVAWNRTLIEIPAIGNMTKWEPKFVFQSCVGCENAELTCGCGGKLCSPHVQTDIQRRVILRENLRQYFIFLFHPDKFMVYVELFQLRCIEMQKKQFQVEQCAIEICSALSFDCFKVNKNIDSIMQQCNGNQLQSLYAQQRQYLDVREYPTFVLNKNQLHIKSKGSMQKQLCRLLNLHNDQNCLQINRGSVIFQTIIDVIYLSLGFLILMLIGSCLIFKFKQLTKKDINKQMHMQVATAIDKYYKIDHSSQQTMQQ